ncbi:MAG: signal peptidase I [Anaerolineae bacterium]|nr:signal peptidase I [Anaerolineae bacterium]
MSIPPQQLQDSYTYPQDRDPDDDQDTASHLPIAPSEASPPPQPRVRVRHRAWWRDIVEIVLLILLTYTPINLMTARAVVEGPSMQPNFFTGDLVIVNRSVYFFSPPSRGDVIVLHNPRVSTGDDLIKRVIGLPGETVEINDGRVYINGILIEEPYIERFCTNCDGSWTLGPDQYFVLGDNRPNSYDSSRFGPISKDLIVGQAWIRYWPLSEFEILSHLNYDDFTGVPAQETP